MQPTQTFSEYPEFGNASSKQKPEDAKYSAGFLPQETLPAEWQNWFLNGATKGITDLNTGVLSIESEINTVLSSRSETPDATKTNQLLTVLNKIKAEAILAAHPVGSLYWTSSTENPSVTFGGGTWTQIKDRFILAAGDTYTNGATGGAATVTLTTDNLPSHSHSCSGTTGNQSNNPSFYWTGSHAHQFYTPNSGEGGTCLLFNNYAEASLGFGAGNAWEGIPKTHIGGIASSTITVSGGTTGNHTHSFSGTTDTKYGDSNGNATAHNNMPPYLVQYCWKRTA